MRKRCVAIAFAASVVAWPAAGEEARPARALAAVAETLRHEHGHCTRYDGITDDLLTAGLGRSGLAAAVAPAVADPLNPTAAELRRLAIYNNYRAIVDVSAGGGYGTLFGPNVRADGTVTTDEGQIAGSECLIYADDGSGRKNVALMVQIPDSFRPAEPCIVTGPSSGSRGIYGAIGTSGEWGLKNGCAVAYTDKGTGTGAHDLADDAVYLIDGVRADADAAGRRASFRARLDDAEREAFNAATPDRFAFKHAHSEQNPEADWDVHVLKSLLFAFIELNRHYPDAAITPGNTIVIGSSVSNGGGASLRAAEIDPFGLIDGVAVSEPNVTPPAGRRIVIVQGGRQPYDRAGKPLYDYTTLINVFQGCANLTQPDAPLNAVPQALAENRCRALRAAGLLSADDIALQAKEAQKIINRYGILPEQNPVAPSHWTLFVPQAVAVTYANAYARARVQDNLCDYSFGATDASGSPIPLADGAAAILFGTANGIPPTGGINVIDNASLGGPRQNTLSVSRSGLADQNLDGALCLRSLWTGKEYATGESSSEASRQLRRSIREVLATADLNGKPAIIVQGRADAVVHPNHAGRAYYARNRQIEKRAGRLRYIEVTNAQHLDALNALPGFDTRYVPLHYYFIQAMDLMYGHLKHGSRLPSSQVVRPIARGGTPGQAPAISGANLPPIRPAPPVADRIRFTAGVLTVPD